MNLVQKLPIGLGLACMMMLSSCSKEDVSAPEPQVGGVNESSGLRGGGNGIELLKPYFAPTIGQPGFNWYPTDWERNIKSPDNLIGLPSGTSNLTNLWGNQQAPWVKPLPTIPGVTDMRSMLTVITFRDPFQNHRKSTVKTKIKNLKSGKKYAVSFFVAGSLRNTLFGAYTPAYPKLVDVEIGWGNSYSFSTQYDLTGMEATWAKKTITFSPEANEAELYFSAYAPEAGQYSYANIFVDKDSIKEVQ